MSTKKESQTSWQLALPVAEPSWTTIILATVAPSAFQAAIFNFVLHGQGDGLINAVAGAGNPGHCCKPPGSSASFPARGGRPLPPSTGTLPTT